MPDKKSKMLHSIWVGPYEVLAVNEDTGNCLLCLPNGMKVHPWFATDKLKTYQARDGTFYPQPTDTQDQEEEYKVDQVLEYDEEKDMYLVSWKNYVAEDNQWEPSVNLENAQEKLNEYWEERSAGATVQ